MASPGYRRCPQDTAYPRTPIVSSGYRGISSGYHRCPAIQVSSGRQWYPQDTVSPGCPPCPRTPNRVYRHQWTAVGPYIVLSTTSFVCAPPDILALALVEMKNPHTKPGYAMPVRTQDIPSPMPPHASRTARSPTLARGLRVNCYPRQGR
eukprot:scaffold50193_cov59-Phaeocystis_antarctica.AAC.2